MKEIMIVPSIYVSEFDINVNPYLTYSQIQQIINSTIGLDTWSERQQNIDMLLLYHATDLGKETIEKYTHNDFLRSGLLETVKNEVKNLNQIYEGIDYTESVARAIIQISKNIEPFLNSFKGKMKNVKPSAK